MIAGNFRLRRAAAWRLISYTIRFSLRRILLSRIIFIHFFLLSFVAVFSSSLCALHNYTIVFCFHHLIAGAKYARNVRSAVNLTVATNCLRPPSSLSLEKCLHIMRTQSQFIQVVALLVKRIESLTLMFLRIKIGHRGNRRRPATIQTEY